MVHTTILCTCVNERLKKIKIKKNERLWNEVQPPAPHGAPAPAPAQTQPPARKNKQSGAAAAAAAAAEARIEPQSTFISHTPTWIFFIFIFITSALPCLDSFGFISPPQPTREENEKIGLLLHVNLIT